MSRFAGPIGVIGVLVLAVVFASLNGSERVTLDFGVFALRGIPVTLVAFGGLFMGMVVMLAAGIHTDLKVRQILRQRLEREDREERELQDHSQRDLFDSASGVIPDELGVPDGEPGPDPDPDPDPGGPMA